MVKAIVGANWGDEGKGKITDMLSQEADIIVRFQGGSNAGHTIKNNYGKFALHMLPSGVFYNHTTSILGNGVALNIPYMFREINDIVSKGVPMPKILVSDRAQILMPYHISSVTEMLGISSKLENLPGQLSGGQQQRVAIARALATKPAILLCDEPTGNLDSRTSQDVLGLLKVTSQQYAQTIVMITHNEEIAQLADRIIRIEDGRIRTGGQEA